MGGDRVTLTSSFVVLVFDEIVPKSYGLSNATRWSLAIERPLATVELASFPVVLLFDSINRRINVALGGDQRIEQSYTDHD